MNLCQPQANVSGGLTLPELSDVLQDAVEQKILLTYSTKFVGECAQHLMAQVKRPTRNHYEEYCRIIVQEYPEFKDPGHRPWVLIVTLKQICICNN